MNIQYTEAALQELQTFQKRQQKLLEDLIAERKFVFGDETIEVTASDITEAAEFIRAYRLQTRRASSLRLLSQLYVVLGATIALGGYFYPTFQNIFLENRVQAMAIVTGVLMMVLGAVSGYLYRSRIRRYEEMERERSYLIRSEKDRT